MENEKSEPDPLDIDELCRQARAFVKAWRLPKPDENKPHTRKEWQQLMEERIYKGWG